MSWDPNKTKLLIKEYHEKPVLWDFRNPNYKDNRKKVKLWEEIASKLDCSVKEVKEKVKNLRTTLHRYVKKRERLANRGQWSQWVHFASLSFLVEDDAPRKGLSVVEDIKSENEDVDEQEVGLNDCETQLDQDLCSSEKHNEESVLCLVESTPRAGSRELVTPTSGVKKRRREDIDRDEEVERADEAYEIPRKTSQRDEFDVYGEHVGNELRKLSWTAQTFTKYHINNILFDAAMGKFDSIPPVQTYSMSSNSSQGSP